MEKRFKKLIDSLNDRIMYFTRAPLDLNGFYGFRYFLVWRNTNSIFKAFKTKDEFIEGLEYLRQYDEYDYIFD